MEAPAAPTDGMVAPPPAALFAPPEPPRSRELPLEFRGSAGEYFRVWAVNLCLTLLTFGVFSAWAKVRKKRYFYAHTLLDGTPFQYLGQPIPILKGRLIAAALLVAYWLSSHLFPTALPFALAVAAVLLPWVVARSAAFQARYSAFRNMTLRFDGEYRAAAKVLYLSPALPALAVIMLTNPVGGPRVYVVAATIFGLAFPWWLRNVKRFVAVHICYGGVRGEFGATGGQFFGMYLVAGLIVLGMTGVLGIGFALGRSGDARAFWMGAVVGYAGFVFAFAFLSARGTNLVWNRLRMGPLIFRSTLRARDLLGLYLTNAIAILASCGMLTPWAVIRTLRYRAEHTTVLLKTDLAEFRGGAATTVRAIGAEVSDLFDLDLSI